MPVTKVFTTSACSKEKGEYSNISEPETVNPVPQVETQVYSSANLLSAVNVLSIAPKVDTSNVEDVKMLSDSDDTQGKTDTTTVDSTDKTHAPIITDMECEAREPIEIDKSPQIVIGLITTPFDSPLVVAVLYLYWVYIF